MDKPAIVVGITGASGAVIGVRVLELLGENGGYVVHLVITSAGALTLRQETDHTLQSVLDMADVVHRNSHIGASIASGTMAVAAMVVTPCSIRTLSAIAHGVTDDLVTRAADVCLKEGRPLLLLVRESPLHAGHLASMSSLASLGGHPWPRWGALSRCLYRPSITDRSRWRRSQTTLHVGS